MTTDTGTLTREDTGTHAVVHVVDPAPPVSAPYSRLCGILDKQVAAERRAVDEFAAWLEGRTAQTAAEIRSAADEQLLEHRQFRLEMAERIRREGTVNLPPAFEEITPAPVRWAEVQPVSLIPAEPPRYATDVQRVNTGMCGVFDTSPAPDESMPGRAVVLAPRDNPLAQAYARAELARQQGWTPDPDDYGPNPALRKYVHDGLVQVGLAADALEPTLEGTYIRPGGGIDWRAEWAELVDDLGRPLRALRAWWRAKQAERDERMGVAE